MWVLFLDFSHRRPPPISDHFVVHQGWSLTRELTVVAAEVPTSGDYKLNIESLSHQPLHKILMTQPTPPLNEHESHNWTQSLNYMVMHQSNPTAPILHVLTVIQWSLQLRRPLEFEFHLQFPCGTPSTELSDFCQSARSGNERECKQTLKKACQG